MSKNPHTQKRGIKLNEFVKQKQQENEDEGF